MKKHYLLSVVSLLLTALIWGVAFVAQTKGGDTLGPITFTCLRCWVAILALLPIQFFSDRAGLSAPPATPEAKHTLQKAGVVCGTFYCGTILFQQLGLYMGTSAGKAGFLTACYIILVPVLGLFLKKHCGTQVWIAIVITLGGLYLLCINGGFSFQFSDVMVMICSLMAALQILSVDIYISRVDVLRLSMRRFLVSGLIAIVPMYWFEMGHSLAGILNCLSVLATPKPWGPLLYAGVLSSGVAYTLSNIGQKNVEPALAALIMSLESVISVIAGWLLLDQTLTGRELLGCVLIFIAVLLAQFPIGKNTSSSQRNETD